MALAEMGVKLSLFFCLLAASYSKVEPEMKQYSFHNKIPLKPTKKAVLKRGESPNG